MGTDSMLDMPTTMDTINNLHTNLEKSLSTVPTLPPVEVPRQLEDKNSLLLSSSLELSDLLGTPLCFIRNSQRDLQVFLNPVVPWHKHFYRKRPQMFCRTFNFC